MLKKLVLGLVGLIFSLIFLPAATYAIVDPLAVPNNKAGIHIISASVDESSPAASLVNSSGGDWGYVTLLIEKKDRDANKWQNFFNDLRKKHLIPLVRIATSPEGNFWQRPDPAEATAWADFLNSLNWPTKNRYVIIYNEPNHATEWGNSVDPASYAQSLDQTITALKKKSPDFFVMNAGFDASAPQKTPAYMDEAVFLDEMNKAVPGIFTKLDGWSSHSYPNPGFVGLPTDTGRTSIAGWQWELNLLRERFHLTKNLPVFITETGWKHAEGKFYDSSLPTPEKVASYYEQAFKTTWNSPQIVAVTPFLLSYSDAPFDHFSFKKVAYTPETNSRVLSATSPSTPYLPQYLALQQLAKVDGTPIQEDKATLTDYEIPRSLVVKENYSFKVTVKNTGQSIWGEKGPIKLVPLEGNQLFGVTTDSIPADQRIAPGDSYTFTVNLKPIELGQYPITFTLFNGEKQFDSENITFQVEVKSAVFLKVKSKLGWKENYQGDYFLTIVSKFTKTLQNIVLNNQGESDKIEAHTLLPDLTYQFTLSKPYYKPKTISQKLNSGDNTLDFGELQPDLPSAILHPVEFWKLLPISN